MPNPDKKNEPAADRRKKPRFAISSSFPLNAVLALPDESGEKWKEWPTTLVDLSATGAHIQVSLAAVTFPESRCRLKLSLGKFKLEIPGTVAHFVGASRLAVGGMLLYFPDPGVERSYHRVLEPVIIGASLAPAEATQEYSVRYKEEYAGKLSGRLTVWREKQGAEISGFDFRMNRYSVEANREPGGDPGAKPALKFKQTAGEEAAGGGPPKPLTEEQEQEARWLFRLAAGNLSTAVAADVRKLLGSLV
jgi:hypothetical protein